MKSSQLVNIALLALMAATPAWAVYKCQDASGRTTFQEIPCSGANQGGKLEVHPASGSAPKLQAPAGAGLAPPTVGTEAPAAPSPAMTETDRLNNLSARLAKENRLATLNNLSISGAQGEMLRAQAQCQAEIEAVRKRKELADNSLAGATWQQSLSAEMQAMAARCDTEQRRLQANLERLLSEKQDLERALSKP